MDIHCAGQVVYYFLFFYLLLLHHKVAHREYNIEQQNAKTLKQYDAKMHKSLCH